MTVRELIKAKYRKCDEKCWKLVDVNIVINN